MYFLEVYFQNFIFRGCIFRKCAVSFLSFDKKRKTSFQTLFKRESELNFPFFGERISLHSLVSSSRKLVAISRGQKTCMKLVWSGLRYTTLHVEFIIMLQYSVVKRSNIKGDIQESQIIYPIYC